MCSPFRAGFRINIWIRKEIINRPERPVHIQPRATPWVKGIPMISPEGAWQKIK
jgi:hypothetical protein